MLTFPTLKHYGVHLGPVEIPAHEGMSRYEDKGLNFYYNQEDFLFKLAAQRNWTWNIIRPGGIVGFTPGSKYHQVFYLCPSLANV